MSFQEVKSEPRQDWQMTSTGVGHHYRKGYYFPSTRYQVNDESSLFGICKSPFNTFMNDIYHMSIQIEECITII